ncbi:DUF7551 domain-containing protein [Halobellus clavatus]|jgi:hypothetical protein|uniref:Uncharacterized protein n=1 Tax=Halobellus clavatus TaxID=660517 RepID=A0A1H3CUA8_9EURY|nr:hypothetical protein [Halobellus clavatus]SDX57727.1 hypothetical protein SAMN04487946_101203 [Halobellus clavatus]
MVGSTLLDIRRHVDALATPRGPYAVVCGRTGCEPSPVTGLRFDDRDTAAEAADAASEYRATLRQYDPQVLFYEPLVHDVEDAPRGDVIEDRTDERVRYLSFCHDVAGATFEALSAAGLRDVESAAMETYLTLAEVVTDPDDFCLTLLWSVTSELARLTGRREQTAVVASAASALRCHDVDTTGRPAAGLEAALDHLEAVGFLDAHAVESAADEAGWRIRLDGYALAERTGRLPTLPVSIALARQLPTTPFRLADATPLDDHTWQLRIEPDRVPGGLASLDARNDRRLYDRNTDR